MCLFELNMVLYGRGIMKKGIVSILLLVFFITFLSSILGSVYTSAKEKLDNSFYLHGTKIVNVEYGSKYEEAGYEATINDENVINKVKIKNNIDEHKVGEYTVEYSLRYLNYKRTLVRYVNIVDNVSPSLIINCKPNQYVAVNSKYTPCSYIVEDNYDEDMSERVTINSNVNTSKIGDYQVTYTATDSSNNSTTQTIAVHVRKKFELNYIKISISKQRLYYYQNNEIVLTTPVTTGKNNATRTGNFKVLRKVRNTELKGKDYVSFVKYWLGYDGSSFGIHDASWRRRFGTMDYTYRGSHGCVNISLKAAAELYDMVEIGTPVIIE